MTDLTNSDRDEAQIQQNLRERIDDGGRAGLLQSELKISIEGLRQYTLNEFAMSGMGDADRHQTLRVYLEVLSDIEQLLLVAIQDGEVALSEIKTIHIN